MLKLFPLFVYLSGYIFLVFVAVCLACGLYYLAELVEEYTSLTKRIIKYSIFGVAVVHVLLLIFDGFPFLGTAVGLGAHALYYLLLKEFPFIQLTSPVFLGGCAAMVLDHWVWFRYFQRVFYKPTHVLGFFLLCVWLVPFGYFISLSVNENVLPMPGGAPSGSTGGGLSGDALPGAEFARKRSSNWIMAAFQYLKRKKDTLVPARFKQLPVYGKSSHLS
eukprot:tig00001371_g8434.t1